MKLGGSTRDRSWLVTGAMCATGALGLLVAAAVSSYLRLPQLIKPIRFDCCPRPGSEV
jgi:hypothetical protein